MIRIALIIVFGLAAYCLLIKYNRLKEEYDELLVDTQLRKDEWKNISIELGEIAPFEDSRRAVLKRKLEKISDESYFKEKEDEKRAGFLNYDYICLLEKEFERINQKTSRNC